MWIVQRVDQPRSRIAWLARCLLNRSVIKSLAKWLVEFWPWKTTNKMLGIAWCSGGNSLCFHGIKGKGWWARPQAFSSDISLSLTLRKSWRRETCGCPSDIITCWLWWLWSTSCCCHMALHCPQVVLHLLSFSSSLSSSSVWWRHPSFRNCWLCWTVVKRCEKACNLKRSWNRTTTQHRFGIVGTWWFDRYRMVLVLSVYSYSLWYNTHVDMIE